MGWSNVPIFMIMTLYKLINKTLIILLLLEISSCRLPTNLGFYQPITLDMTVPDGPPEYKAGWHNGCRTALGSSKYFANGRVYEDKEGTDFGSGIYQHDKVYQTSWGHGFFACNIHSAVFTHYHSMRHMPLQ